MSKFLPVFLLFPFFLGAQNSFDCVPFSGSVECRNHPSDNSVMTNIFVRNIDGSNNNLQHPEWGKAHIAFARKMGANYDGDGNTMYQSVNPRTISNNIVAQDRDLPSQESLSALTFAFLQFLDHDITASAEGKTEVANIAVPAGDPLFDPFWSGTVEVPFKRSAPMPGSGENGTDRDQINEITAWIDGSGVYGSDIERASWLRSGLHGKLKSTPSAQGELLPCNTIDGNCNTAQTDPAAPHMASDTDRCGNLLKVFVAGDVRANEQPTLLSLHTLFLREHNRICDQRVAAGFTNDEENYQYARRRVAGLIQSITFNEVLPALGVQLPTYWGYRPNVNPNIWNVFATAAYRLGHTMVTPELWAMDENCNDLEMSIGCDANTMGVFGGTFNCADDCGSTTLLSPLQLRDAFFNPSIVANNGIDGLLRGAARQTQQDIDTKVIEDLRSFLFGAPGAGGLDLAALNIQRGRDHGLPMYNAVRAAFNLPARSIEQMTSDPALRQALTDTYGSADNIDPWIGMLAEDKLPNRAIGQTLRRILTAQFRKLRDGDRFFYLVDPMLNWSSRLAIHDARLADLIARNTDVNDVEVAFYAQPCQGNYCEAEGQTTWLEWIKRIRVHNYFDNNSGNNGGYASFTHQQFTLMRGVSTPIQLTPGYMGPRYYENWRIWIDFNQDGNFDPQTERVYQRRKRGRINGYLTLPDDVPLGTYRLRIAMSGDGTYPGPCESMTYGEIEDYTVTVTEAPAGGRLGDAFVNDTPETDEASSYDRMLAYPNPTDDRLTLAFQTHRDGDELHLHVTDLLGRRVKSQSLGPVRAGENVAEISLLGLPAGMYVVSIFGDGVEKRARIKLVDRL